MVGERESAGRECIDAGTLKYVRAIAATAAASATTAKDPSKGLQHQPSTSATTTTPKTDALATVTVRLLMHHSRCRRLHRLCNADTAQLTAAAVVEPTSPPASHLSNSILDPLSLALSSHCPPKLPHLAGISSGRASIMMRMTGQPQWTLSIQSVSQLSPLKNVCKGHTQTRVAGGLHCQWKNMHSFIHWAPRYGVSNKQIGESESERELAVAGKHRHQSTQKRVEV